MMNAALIDNDVLSVFAETRQGNNVDLYKCFFDDLSIDAQVNQFVYDYEVVGYETFINSLISQSLLNQIMYDDYLDDFNRELYEENFLELYNAINAEGIDKSQIFQRAAKSNKGEIHSMLCAKFLNIPFFISNDKHSRFISNHLDNSRQKVEVHKISDCCKTIASLSSKTTSRNQLKIISRKCSDADKEEISKIWNDNK